MTPTPSDATRLVCQHLRAAAPQQWEAFVEIFDAYATEVTVAVTRAEQHEILVAQGRAKAFLHLLDIFKNCHLTPTHPKPQP